MMKFVGKKLVAIEFIYLIYIIYNIYKIDKFNKGFYNLQFLKSDT